MWKTIGVLVSFLILGSLTAAGAVLYVLITYSADLPEYSQLADYQPATTTRVHAGDGRLLAEYAREKRVFVPVEAMPRRLINAFLSAEDQDFFTHQGVDYRGVVRAVLVNLRNIFTNRRLVGASTITQQVAKNFLLTNEVSFDRKIKEILLAFRIERALRKERILELYLNEIYLGFGSYGVAAAALNYFNKSLDDLTLAETAFLAALPKAPSNYHPIRRRDAAFGRRNWVIGRMLDDGHVSADEAEMAKREPLLIRSRDETEFVEAPYFAEEVRRELMEAYGETALYEGGLSVRTTMDPRLQAAAVGALRQGLERYDRRHGWRGPLTKLPDPGETWSERLNEVDIPLGPEDWRLAVVLAVDAEGVDVGIRGGMVGRIPYEEVRWARAWIKGQKRGPMIKHPADVLAVGDVVPVKPLAEGSDGEFSLRQIPEINGGIVAMDPHTGRVLAMVGGWSYARSQFNRATQAARQPGSAFKPFVYAAALDHGFTPSSLVLDAPFVISQGVGLGKWKPANYTKKFYGPSTLRLGIEKSRNLMTVRLAQYIGMDLVVDYALRFGIVDEMPPILSMALGAGETKLIDLTTAYAILVNGGKRVAPTLIDRLQDRRGKTVFRHDKRECLNCMGEDWQQQAIPRLPDTREVVVSHSTAYQLVSMLQGVVQRGTGVRIRAVGKPLAGKTGTTNDSFDTWFIGFSPDLAVGVFVGFDEPRSLGKGETGSNVAAPVFRDFMAAALANQPAIPFRVPAGIRLVRVNASSGLPAGSGDRRVILEAFRPGTEPSGERSVLDGSESAEAVSDTTKAGTGGLY